MSSRVLPLLFTPPPQPTHTRAHTPATRPARIRTRTHSHTHKLPLHTHRTDQDTQASDLTCPVLPRLLRRTGHVLPNQLCGTGPSLLSNPTLCPFPTPRSYCLAHGPLHLQPSGLVLDVIFSSFLRSIHPTLPRVFYYKFYLRRLPSTANFRRVNCYRIHFPTRNGLAKISFDQNGRQGCPLSRTVAPRRRCPTPSLQPLDVVSDLALAISTLNPKPKHASLDSPSTPPLPSLTTLLKPWNLPQPFSHVLFLSLTMNSI